MGGLCQRKGANATVTHDELLDANVAASDALSALGILTVFNTGNECNEQLARSPTVAYGNATGGVIEGFVNLTARAPGGPQWTGQTARSKGTTVPELAYITAELRRRGVASRFACDPMRPACNPVYCYAAGVASPRSSPRSKSMTTR